MKVRIEYCGPCGYERRAQSLASQIRAAHAAEVELVATCGIALFGGRFDVFADGELVVSKCALGRLPTDAEVLEKLERHAPAIG